jgi:predicted nucleotidyltransferase
MDLEELDPEVRRIASSLSKRLLDQGAKAVLLTGSQVRGRARPDSDIDVFVVGDGPEAAHEVVDGRIVSTHWSCPE